MEIFEFDYPTKIYFGAKSLGKMGELLKKLDKKSVFIVVDNSLLDQEFYQDFRRTLAVKNIVYEEYWKFSKIPTESDLENCYQTFSHNPMDTILGIGGGVAMDMARGLILRSAHVENVFDFDVEKPLGEIPLFLTAPTTCGTGSEVGRSAIITDSSSRMKKIIFSPELMAKYVFIDPYAVMDLPKPIKAATGMDALTHNIESYIAKGFHPLSDGIAIEGIRLIHENFLKAVHTPDLTNVGNLMLGATMGAIAFQKGLGVVHSMAHALSAHKEIHHGLANAIMLNYGIDFNRDYCDEKILRIMKYIGLPRIRFEFFVDYLRELNELSELPLTLSSLNLNDDDINELSQLAFKDPCHQTNPKEVSEEDFKILFKKAL